MDVITIDSKAFQEIMKKLEKLEQNFSDLKNEADTPLSEKWLDNSEVCRILNTSKRTLQMYRDDDMLSFSKINHKIYYKARDIENFLKKNYTQIRNH